MADEATRLLKQVLQALGDDADHFVVVGGWAMHIYRCLEGAKVGVEVEPTLDVDLATEPRGAKIDDLVQRLGAAGLVPHRSRATSPPVTRFQDQAYGEDDLAPSHVEFLVPLIGGRNDVVVEIAPGVGAQTLRYLDISTTHSIRVPVERIPFLGNPPATHVRVPSPVSFLIGKALTLSKRKPNKRDKDYAYVYQLALITRDLWPDMRDELQRLALPQPWRDRAYTRLRTDFETPQSTGCVSAVRSLDDPELDERRVHQVMKRFLDALGIGST